VLLLLIHIDEHQLEPTAEHQVVTRAGGWVDLPAPIAGRFQVVRNFFEY
jgi:hypothetical protein